MTSFIKHSCESAKLRGMCGTLVAFSALAMAAVAGAAGDALAVGTGTVVAGSATITNPNATTTLITQTSGKAVIDWTNFDTAAGETVRFAQPNSGSISLNRISGGPTSFFGNLIANGKVWLINPDGMLFGAGSKVNVNSLLLSTAGISNATGNGFFTNPTHKYAFDQAGNSVAKITIDNAVVNALGNPAKAGYIVIQAPQVTVANASKLFTPGGDIQLLGGETFTVDFFGDGLINFAVIDTPVLVQNPGSTSTIDVNNGSSLTHGKITIGALIREDAVLDNVINLGGQTGVGTYNLATNPQNVVIKTAPNVYETIIPNPVVAAPQALNVASNADAFTNTSALTRSLASLGDESVRDTTVNPAVSNVSYERPYRVGIDASLANGALTLLAPSAGTPATQGAPSPDALANLSPAAGGNNEANASTFADLAPAAGGEAKSVNCANSFLDSAWRNDPSMSSCAD